MRTNKFIRVRIVCYEDPNKWIIGKFAKNLEKELRHWGVEAEIAGDPSAVADINHHLIYTGYKGKNASTDTLMITHVDSLSKLAHLKEHMRTAAMGICMSADTVSKLVLAGVKREKLCYVNPAHDGNIKPRPVVLGITCRTYEDGRKQEELLVNVASKFGSTRFAFIIMGSGWDSVVAELRKLGFSVEYHPEFDQKIYEALFKLIDYYVYYPCDEGSMGYLDALAAGVPTIVSAQGFHLDASSGITYALNGSPQSLFAVLKQIDEQRRCRELAVSHWTWKNYARKHLDIWEFLLGLRNHSSLVDPDGLNSIASFSKTHVRATLIERLRFWEKLIRMPASNRAIWKRIFRIVKIGKSSGEA